MAKKNKKPELSSDKLERITFDAMRVHGILPPTVAVVKALDAELSDVTLPFGPSDPDELLKKLDADVGEEAILPFSSAEEASIGNLARAARQGGELTEEIEQRMADDKARFLRDEHDEE